MCTIWFHAYENSFDETVDAGIIIKLIEIVIFYRYEISRSGGEMVLSGAVKLALSSELRVKAFEIG